MMRSLISSTSRLNTWTSSAPSSRRLCSSNANWMFCHLTRTQIPKVLDRTRFWISLTKASMTLRSTSNVCAHSTPKQSPNRVLGTPPPDISPLESFLPRPVRTTLAQLRSGHCRLLKSYMVRITTGVSDVCPECGVAPHSVEHLFNCSAHPTQLTVQDLWDNPAEVADFLNLDSWRQWTRREELLGYHNNNLQLWPLTPKSEAFRSVPKCVNGQSLVEIHLCFSRYKLTLFRVHTHAHADRCRTVKSHCAFGQKCWTEAYNVIPMSLKIWSTVKFCTGHICTVWVKKNIPLKFFWHFFPNSCEFLVQILHTFYTFQSTLDCKFLFNYLQLWRSYAILSSTTIMCSKCSPSTKTHAGWSQLTWHNFAIVGDNWIKICIPA